MLQPKDPKCEQLTMEEERQLYTKEMYRVLFVDGIQNNLIPYEQLVKIELAHLVLSYALGRPVGIIKTQKGLKSDQVTSITMLLERKEIEIESIMEKQYQYMFNKVFQQAETPFLSVNPRRQAFLNLICARSPTFQVNDQLILQLVGTLALILSKFQGVPQSFLYHAQLYPIGFRRKKILLQKLLDDDEGDSDP